MKKYIKRTGIKLELKDGVKHIIRTVYYDNYNGYFIKYDGQHYEAWIDECGNWQVIWMKVIDVIL